MIYVSTGYFCFMMRLKTFLFFSILCILFACNKMDVFEKNVSLPKHSWESSFQPTIEFEIKDTIAAYNLFVVVRHSNSYKFNNLWIKATVKQPGSDSTHSQQFDLLLANDSKGWLGEGMDDIFEHRILIQPQTKFSRSGKYQISIQQIMRQDPLEHVMNIGLRVEKAP